MGNYLDFALKIAHRGNTGSHKGKRKLACLSENYICALLLFFSVFGLWHKANSAHFSGSYEKICSQIKKLTCNCSFSELTSHTTKAIRKSFVSPVFCRMYPSPMKVSGIHSGYFASDQKWIGYTTLAHLVAERCVIPRKMLNS